MSEQLDEEIIDLVEYYKEQETGDMCEKALTLIVRLFDPEDFGENAEVEQLYNIVQVIKARQIRKAQLIT